jgi:hypothetical protein
MIRESKQQSPADVAQFAAIEDRTCCRRREFRGEDRSFLQRGKR